MDQGRLGFSPFGDFETQPFVRAGQFGRASEHFVLKAVAVVEQLFFGLRKPYHVPFEFRIDAFYASVQFEAFDQIGDGKQDDREQTETDILDAAPVLTKHSDEHPPAARGGAERMQE